MELRARIQQIILHLSGNVFAIYVNVVASCNAVQVDDCINLDGVGSAVELIGIVFRTITTQFFCIKVCKNYVASKLVLISKQNVGNHQTCNNTTCVVRCTLTNAVHMSAYQNGGIEGVDNQKGIFVVTIYQTTTLIFKFKSKIVKSVIGVCGNQFEIVVSRKSNVRQRFANKLTCKVHFIRSCRSSGSIVEVSRQQLLRCVVGLIIGRCFNRLSNGCCR